MKMKNVILMMTMFFTICIGQVLAQDAPKPKKQFLWNKLYMEEIGINAETQEKINMVKKDNDAEMKLVRENSSLSADEKKQGIKELNIKRQKAIYSNLTPEQIKKSREIAERIKAENEANQQ
jgi:thiamine biosynthesis lipoprotein ApbE